MLQLIRVNGSSMSPALRDGDFVLVLSSRVWRSPVRGCVVLVAHPQLGPLLKRVAEWDSERGVTLRGDNNLSSSSAAMGCMPHAAIRGVAWLRIAPTGISRVRK